MPVTEFECQIARGQIGRYLGGGPLSPQALQGLEEHLSECPGCKALVAERRASLLGQLGGEMPTHAVASVPVAQENPLVAALRARREKDEPKPVAAAPRYAKAEAKAKPVFGKPMVLAALLALVLVGMSYVSRATRGDGALGTKASAGFAADSLPSATVAKKPEPEPAKPKPVEAKEPVAAKPTPEPAPTNVVEPKPKPIVEPIAPKPKPVVATNPAPTKRVPVRKRARPNRRPASPPAAVRVYGLDGLPLKP